MTSKSNHIATASLFITGFFQVFFVSIQTYFIAHNFTIGVAIGGFFISFIWSYNVRRIAFGGFIDRVVYSVGASAGAVVGLITGQWVLV